MTRTTLGILGALFLLAAGALSWEAGNLVWGLLLVPLAMVLGPWMGLWFPFPLGIKLGYAAGLLLAAALGVAGVWSRQLPWAAPALVTGVLLWGALGLLGLGTGT